MRDYLKIKDILLPRVDFKIRKELEVLFLDISKSFPKESNIKVIQLSSADENLIFFYNTYKIVFGREICEINRKKNVLVGNDGDLIFEIETDFYLLVISREAKMNGGMIIKTYLCFDTNDKEKIKNVLNKMVDDCIKYLRKENRRKTFSNKPLEKIFLPNNLKEKIIEDIKDFSSSYREYKKMDLPWKRGYIFSGPPGNGKTLMLSSIIKAFNYESANLINLIDGSGRLSLNKKLKECRQRVGYIDIFGMSVSRTGSVPEPTIYYLEDMDKIVGKNDKDYSIITLSNLLIELDGVAELEDGFILIATTNNIKTSLVSLTDAIIGRPGRFDRVFEFNFPEVGEIEEFLDYRKIKISKDNKNINKEIAIKFNKEKYSMAFCEEFIKSIKMKYKKNEVELIEVKNILDELKKYNELKKEIQLKNKLGFEKKINDDEEEDEFGFH